MSTIKYHLGIILMMTFFYGCDPVNQNNFDQDMTSETLNTLIKKVERAGARVRAICCDMGNKILLSQLGVNRRKRMYFFQNPSRPESKVFLVLPFWHLSYCFCRTQIFLSIIVLIILSLSA